MAVLAPMPTASDNPPIAVKPEDFRTLLTPLRAPSTIPPTPRHPHWSRVPSFPPLEFPNSRRAARSASRGSAPRSTCSRTDISKWLRTSSSNSSSHLRLPNRRLTQLIAAPLFPTSDSDFQSLFVLQSHHRIYRRRSQSRYEA